MAHEKYIEKVDYALQDMKRVIWFKGNTVPRNARERALKDAGYNNAIGIARILLEIYHEES